MLLIRGMNEYNLLPYLTFILKKRIVVSTFLSMNILHTICIVSNAAIGTSNISSIAFDKENKINNYLLFCYFVLLLVLVLFDLWNVGFRNLIPKNLPRVVCYNPALIFATYTRCFTRLLDNATS